MKKGSPMKPMLDVSRTITPGGLVYPGDPPLTITPLCTRGPDSPYNISQLNCTTHIMTPLDAPLHFVENGASLDSLPLERFKGETIVIEVTLECICIPCRLAVSALSRSG
jgi:arylformamidase